MKTETKIAEGLKKKFKGWLKGCGDKTSTGGTCGNLSRDEQLVFNRDLTDSKFEKVKRYCEECTKSLFGSRGEIISHKVSCERTKEKWINLFNLLKEKSELKPWVNAFIMVEIEDNEKAIKLYNEVGI